MKTNGLHPVRKDESVFLADNNDEIKALIGDIIIFTADEKNNTIGRLEYEMIREDQEYRFTILLDDDYLKDEKTVYPIKIDPTIEIKYDRERSRTIEDVTLNSFTPQSGTSYFLYVGREQNGSLDRALMRFPNLYLDDICANQITSAKVYITDLGCQSDQDITVNCYVYKRTAPAWSENGTTSWSGVGNDYKGLVFKASAAFENQTGSGIQKWKKTFASYNRAMDKPNLIVTYVDGIKRDECYSEYAPNKYNYGSIPGNSSSTYL